MRHNRPIFARSTPCSKKVVRQLISITQSFLNGFSKFLHCHTLWKIWDKRVINDFTTPKTCLCTTLGNINFQKLLQLKHGNRKLEFKSMKLNLLLLPLLLRDIHKVSGSSHLSKTMAQRTQNASLQHSCFTR